MALFQDLKTYLDSSERGVVYFSLGTNVSPSTLSADKIQAITNGLAKLKYDVLIKWDSENLSGKGNNTKVAKWLPQSDLLRKYLYFIGKCLRLYFICLSRIYYFGEFFS